MTMRTDDDMMMTMEEDIIYEQAMMKLKKKNVMDLVIGLPPRVIL